jgi:hypothetical protein
VTALASQAGSSGRLAAVTSSPADLITLKSMVHPRSWDPPGPGVNYVLPDSSGTATTTTTLDRGGRYSVWIGGSFRGQVEISVDGRSAGKMRNKLSHGGQYAELGELTLSPGRHEVTLHYDKGSLHPGSTGDVFPLGPIVLSSETDARQPFFVQPDQARTLCGRRLDWIEAVS